MCRNQLNNNINRGQKPKAKTSNSFQNKFWTGIDSNKNLKQKMKVRTAISCHSGFYALGGPLTFNRLSAFLHAVQPNFTSV